MSLTRILEERTDRSQKYKHHSSVSIRKRRINYKSLSPVSKINKTLAEHYTSNMEGKFNFNHDNHHNSRSNNNIKNYKNSNGRALLYTISTANDPRLKRKYGKVKGGGLKLSEIKPLWHPGLNKNKYFSKIKANFENFNRKNEGSSLSEIIHPKKIKKQGKIEDKIRKRGVDKNSTGAPASNFFKSRQNEPSSSTILQQKISKLKESTGYPILLNSRKLS